MSFANGPVVIEEKKFESTKRLDDTTTTIDDLEFSNDKASDQTSAEEKSVLRKIDLRAMPIMALWEIGGRWVSDSLITKAKLGGLMDDLNLTEGQYRWCLTGPFIAFFFLSIPVNLVFRIWNAHYLVATLALLWGGVAMCTAGVTNFAGLLICQIVIGVCKSANNPAQSYYIALWYKRQESAQRIGWFTIAGFAAYAFLGLITYGISTIPTDTTINSWQWMYVILGAPSVLLAIITYFVLPDRPETCKFLSEKERKIAIARIASSEQMANLSDTLSWKQLLSTVTDWKVWVYSAIFALGSIIGSGIRLNLPSIINGMGDWGERVSLALTTPPWILTGICNYFFCLMSDKWAQRGYFLLATYSLAAASLLMIIFIPEQYVGVHYFLVCLLSTGAMMDGAIRMAWCINNFFGLTRRAAAVAIVYSIDAAGNAIGGQAYFDPPKYRMGHVIALCAYALNAVLILGLRYGLNRANNERDAMTAEEKEQQIVKYGGIELVGDRHPDYRYIL